MMIYFCVDEETVLIDSDSPQKQRLTDSVCASIIKLLFCKLHGLLINGHRLYKS